MSEMPHQNQSLQQSARQAQIASNKASNRPPNRVEEMRPASIKIDDEHKAEVASMADKQLLALVEGQVSAELFELLKRLTARQA